MTKVKSVEIVRADRFVEDDCLPYEGSKLTFSLKLDKSGYVNVERFAARSVVDIMDEVETRLVKLAGEGEWCRFNLCRWVGRGRFVSEEKSYLSGDIRPGQIRIQYDARHALI